MLLFAVQRRACVPPNVSISDAAQCIGLVCFPLPLITLIIPAPCLPFPDGRWHRRSPTQSQSRQPAPDFFFPPSNRKCQLGRNARRVVIWSSSSRSSLLTSPFPSPPSTLVTLADTKHKGLNAGFILLQQRQQQQQWQ